MTGTKFGCGTARVGRVRCTWTAQAVRSCITALLTPMARARDITIEGLSGRRHASRAARLESEQRSPVRLLPDRPDHAGRCAAQTHPEPTDQQIVDAMSGNICRCGTYQRIRAAIKSAAGTI